MRWRRTAAAKTPYQVKTTKVIAINTALSISMEASWCGAWAGMNCGKKAKKNMVSFGFSRLRGQDADLD